MSLLPCAAAGAPAEGQPAPDFDLVGAGAASVRGLRDRARVVIVFAPAGRAQGIQGMKWNAQRRFLGQPGAAAGLAERDVVVVAVSDGKETWAGGLKIARPADGTAAAVRAIYGIGEGQFLAVLVGKDGEVKRASTQPFQPAQLFAIIDAMPGRKQEMKGK
jgi:hypothetical protein